MPLWNFNGRSPQVAIDSFVAENATLVGDVQIGSKSSVWFGAVLRAEDASIKIGSGSNVQDNCTIHTDEAYPVMVGDNVSIGHGTIVHGATISSNCLIGMGSILLNGSSIGENSLVAAGSLVTQGKIFGELSLILGSPATRKRDLTTDEVARIKTNSEHYNTLRDKYLSKMSRPR